ncbi:hypothetical protein PPERSA_12811 [Pseudocohnilembus persalinus]|uniref:Uncharacterized protein n=1 Tax=Pseudocohnilembus persalinus TaxID=266149 RepID=A0A0V0QEN8_PSEPJ|nr:hypothetical protein PPERSA_12811 [Pseudocohnilembus persalinus]|eukprot:KRX00592.1 hypothetical protein PPERSA_12811 [Pseudocohnilembus persalinus]
MRKAKGNQISITHTPQINYFIPDSHAKTNFTEYLKDVIIDQWRPTYFQVKNLTFEREYTYQEKLKMDNQLNVKVQQRRSIYKLDDFYQNFENDSHYTYEDGEHKINKQNSNNHQQNSSQQLNEQIQITHKYYDNKKLMQFLENTANVQEIPLNIVIFVVETEEEKNILSKDIRRLNYVDNNEGLIWEVRENEKNIPSIPLYTSVLAVQDYNEMLEYLPLQYSEEFLDSFFDWSQEKQDLQGKSIGYVAHYDKKYLQVYQQFVENINKIILNEVKNGENLIKSTRTMAELLGSEEYVQFKEIWYQFQETLFMSQTLYSQLQYKTAIQYLNKAQEIFKINLVPILSTNRAAIRLLDKLILIIHIPQVLIRYKYGQIKKE